MELFIWLWAYDGKLFCDLRPGYTSFVYLWLLPVAIGTMVLFFAYFAQATDSRDTRTCFKDEYVAEQGRVLSKLVLI